MMASTMDYQANPGSRLAEAVKARREELHLTRQDVRDAAVRAGQDISVSTLANIERAHSDRYARDSLDGLDAGLEWPAGTAHSILAGSAQVDRPLSEHLDLAKAAHLERLAQVAVPSSKLTDAEALLVVLKCLSDEQYGMVARAVQADDRFVSA